MEPVVRDAAPRDREAIVTIYNHYVRNTAATFEIEPVTVAGRRAWFAEHPSAGPHRILVATDGAETVLGWASSSSFRPRAAYSTTVECSVYCRPGSLAAGIGTSLYTALFAALEPEDLERIVAGIALPNPPSVALHRRFGFREVGVFTRVGRKFGRYWDVAWFERAARATGGPTAPKPHGSSAGAEASGPGARPPR